MKAPVLDDVIDARRTRESYLGLAPAATEYPGGRALAVALQDCPIPQFMLDQLVEHFDVAVTETKLSDLERQFVEGFPRISADNPTQWSYEILRLAGHSHNLAEMLALAAPPSVKSDSTWNRGRCNGNQFEGAEAIGDAYAEEARAAGVNIQGAFYCHGLAEYAGDPRAWVRDRGDVERVARARGLKVEGDVRCDYTDRFAPAPDVDVADDIVEQKVLQMLDDNPELEHTADPGEVYHQAKEAIKPFWCK